MSVQLSTIRTRVQANWPSNYYSSDLTDDKTDEFINKVQRRLCRARNWFWMESEVYRDTVDETRSYTLPTAGDSNWTDADAGTVKEYKDEKFVQIINASSYKEPVCRDLKKIVEHLRQFRDTTSTGTPTHYALFNSKLQLFPLPGHSYNGGSAWQIRLFYYGYLADLSGDTSNNNLTNSYSEVLEYGATALGYRFGHDTEMAEYWESKMKEIVQEMVEDDIQRQLGAIQSGMTPAPGCGMTNDSSEMSILYDLKATYE